MHQQLSTWQFIQDRLQQKVAVMLLYVLESKGSSPGRQGFVMAVDALGNMRGSLGGGIMEHKFVELAKARLKEAADERSVHQQIHDKAAAKNQSGMICSGEQTIFLYTLSIKDAPAIAAICSILHTNGHGSLHLHPAGLSVTEALPDQNFSLQLDHVSGSFALTEKIGYKHTLHIIGGGHCALALSRLASGLDFYIRLYDERAALNTLRQNAAAHEKIIVENYSALSSFIEQGTNQYVVVMTVGYRTDAVALRALSGMQFRYIGLLGSSTKTKRLLAELAQENLPGAWLAQIYAPIGVAIKSQTPEEIAVSIAAQLIQVKNAHL